MRPLTRILIVTLAITLCSCGGRAKTTVEMSPNKGQELLDLQEAYNQGILTESEYEKQKKKILKQ